MVDKLFLEQGSIYLFQNFNILIYNKKNKK